MMIPACHAAPKRKIYIDLPTIRGESQLSADHGSILIVPGVITYRAIGPVDTNLHPPPCQCILVVVNVIIFIDIVIILKALIC